MKFQKGNIAVMEHAITKKHALLAQQTVEVVFLLYLPPHQLPRHRKEVALMEVEAAEVEWVACI